MINVAIVGVGYWGANLVRGFNDIEGAHLSHVVDKKPGRLDFIRKRYPHVIVTDDLESVLKDPSIDAVAVATPVPTHYAVSRSVLEAGKDLFVEKPLAFEVRHARELRDVAAAHNRILSVGHVYQFSPAVTWLANTLKGGKLGRIFHIDSIRVNLGPPESEVDVLWDLAPHDLSIVLYLMKCAGLNTSVKSIDAVGECFVHGSMVDLSHVIIRFESGISCHIHVSWVTSNKVRLLQLSTEKSTVVFDDLQPIEKIKVYNEGVDTRKNASDSGSEELSYRPGDIFIPTLPRQEPLALELRHFIECVETRSQPINGGDIGVEVVELLVAISERIQQH